MFCPSLDFVPTGRPVGARRMGRFARLCAALVLVSAAATNAVQARPCAEVDSDARAAQATHDLTALIRFYHEAHDPVSGCDPAFLADFGRDVALAHVDAFASALAEDPDPEHHKYLLEEARSYGEPWQLLLTLAEVEYEGSNHDLAAAYYQQAIRQIETATRGVNTGSAADQNLPSPEDFEMIYGRMAESALLANTFSPPAASRGEDVGGLFTESYRGYVVQAVPVPVQFQFDSTRFTAKGAQVAQYLLEYLLGQNLPLIRLVGHTDPVGPADYNYGLSLRRAQAVADYLLQGGYAGAIEVEGHGETEPFQPVDPARFANDLDAKHQLDRRVELVRNPN